MKKENKVTVYADLNCPYCYALNERLVYLNAVQAVIWKPIEHAPDLHAHSFTKKDQQELVSEVDDVKAKAADVTLRLPNTRPNSRKANELLATIIRAHPDKEVNFRTAAFRALWQRGEDFSNPEILEQLLASCGLPNLQVISSAKEDLSEWHCAWELGQFARKIPSLESNIGYKILGFPPVEQLKTFLLDGKTQITSFKDAACIASARYLIAVISDQQSDWQKPKLLEAISRCNLYASVNELINSLSESSKLDLIVLNSIKQNPLATIRQLKNSTMTQYIPIVLLLSEVSEEIQIDAYRAGVAEVVSSSVNEEILGHRIVRLLHSKRHTDKLYELAHIDALTGLSNRREFDESINREWKRKMREEDSLSILMIDVDGFKAYNDTYGHSKGDEVLRRLAEVINSCVNRPTDLTARFGGDEFVLILPGTDTEGAKLVAELIRTQIAVHDIKNISSPVRPYVTVSIGLAEVNNTTKMSMEEFIAAADRALYKAKEKGRDQIIIAD